MLFNNLSFKGLSNTTKGLIRAEDVGEALERNTSEVCEVKQKLPIHNQILMQGTNCFEMWPYRVIRTLL